MRTWNRAQTWNRTIATLQWAAVIMVAAVAGRRSDAAILAGTSFTINVGPSARVLAALGTANYDKIVMEESCDNPHLRTWSRNKPAIRLDVANTTNAGVGLSSFSLKINEDPYIFGNGDFASDAFTDFIRKTTYVDAGVSILGSSLSADKQTLTVNFSGLTAGKKVIFNADLDVLNDPSMFPYPDYRVVLNGAPLTSTASPTAPATISGTFSDGITTLTQSKDLTQETMVMEFFNQTTRPYAEMDTVEVVPQELITKLSDPYKVNVPNAATTLNINTMSTLADAIKLSSLGDTGTIIDILSYMITGTNANLFQFNGSAAASGTLTDQIIAGTATSMKAYSLKFLGSPTAGMFTANVKITTSAGDVTFPVMAMTQIPEPATWMLAGLAVGAIATRRKLSLR